VKLAFRMLVREWRSGELVLLFAALTLGIAMVTGIGLFAERLQAALVGEASVYLGADRVLQVSDPVADAWLSRAAQEQVRTARTAVFPTMIYAGDHSVLSSLKAVSPAYPLRGELDIRAVEDAANTAGAVQSVAHGPAAGAAWVEANILTQLAIQLGDSIDVGEKSLRVTHVLVREGDAGSSFYGIGARVMISDADLPATQLILPGSRVEYRYLFAGEEADVTRFFAWLTPQLSKPARVITLNDNQPGIAGALDKASLFLRLAGSLGVLLAALASAFAAQRYCERHADVIAVMKTLGASRAALLGLLAGQMGGLWLAATVCGFAIGEGVQFAFFYAMADWVPANLPAATSQPFMLGAATGLICLFSFVSPPFWRLQAVPPWRVLRSDVDSNGPRGIDWLPGVLGILGLLLLYSRNPLLVGLLAAGLLALALLAGLFGWLLLRGGRRLRAGVGGLQTGSILRLGMANVQRRQRLSLLQIIVFGICFLLLSVMILLRTSLLAEWKLQLPVDAPNVFLINIAGADVDLVKNGLQDIGIQTADMYPMVRGRLTAINGKQATELFDESVGEVYRELNLSWNDRLPSDNRLMAGIWHGSVSATATPASTNVSVPTPVSIEKNIAKRLHVQVGDALVFTIGGENVSATVTSIRELDWDKMTPNFYFLFPSGVLEHYNATWMTSLYRSEAQQKSLTQALRPYPSVTAYPVDELIRRIQTIVERASLAVEVVLWLVLMAGVLVLLTCLRASLDQRMHEGALLRTLGAGQRLILGSLLVEFVFLGLAAGLLAAIGAEVSAWALQTQLFKMAFSFHYGIWLWTPLASTLLIGIIGTAFCWRVVRVPPMLVLRESA
jgi:putative ABC transport system permease protein